MNMEAMTGRIARDLMAERLVRGYRTGGPMAIEMEGRKVRQLLGEAKRELEKMVREAVDLDLKRVTENALAAIQVARETVEAMIGVGMSVEVNEQTGFRSSDRTAAPVWVNLTGMRKTVDRMAEQVKVWVDREAETAELGESKFNYGPYYTQALTALDDCSERLARVEKLV